MTWLCVRSQTTTQPVGMSSLDEADEYHVEDLNAVIPLGPDGVRHGVLKNGMTYVAAST